MSDTEISEGEIIPEDSEDETPDNFYIDMLTGETHTASPKKLLIQKVLRQLIESYGFDRADLGVNYKPRIQGHGRPFLFGTQRDKKTDTPLYPKSSCMS